MKSRDLFVSVVMLSSVSLVGCNNQLLFSSNETESRMSLPSINPPVLTPQPTMVLKSGACSVAGENVLSCLSCNSTEAVNPPPLLSRKAEELLNVMAAGCSVPNKSDPAGYIPPTKEQLLARLIQCSPAGYPDTAFEGTQFATIQSLLHDPTSQQNAFGSLYYNGASKDFETYFGLEIGEARYAFCRGDASFKSGGVYPKEYYDSLYNGINYTLPAVYQRAQIIRENLRNCMAQSLSNPTRNQPSPVPGRKCSFESAEGHMSSLVVDKIDQWRSGGLTVYFEGFGQCGVITNPRSYLDRNEFVKVAVKKCE
ncbi:hypothetical protein [Bdellovibrio sp. HCB-162]|uniref:hypothetical protein n=1 Tax=Bdellovibrio sp. HCB-162 TaxID=3394234 RepID=UPI0039BD5D7D